MSDAAFTTRKLADKDRMAGVCCAHRINFVSGNSPITKEVQTGLTGVHKRLGEIIGVNCVTC